MHRSPPVPVPAGLRACRALLAYEGPAREVVARLKYRNARSSLAWLSAGMSALVQPHDAPAAVTWAPTTPARRRGRGFDQAELLAGRLSARLGLPCVGVLVRQPGEPQTGRSHGERRIGPHFEVPAAAKRRLRPGTLLLVDDVITTGATMSAAASALQRAGVQPVIGLAAAYTAPPSWSAPRRGSTHLPSGLSPDLEDAAWT